MKQEQATKEYIATVENKLFINILNLEIERIKYSIKGYLRTRLLKVENII